MGRIYNEFCATIHRYSFPLNKFAYCIADQANRNESNALPNRNDFPEGCYHSKVT